MTRSLRSAWTGDADRVLILVHDHDHTRFEGAEAAIV